MFREQTVRLSDALETLLFRNLIETGHKGLGKNGFGSLTKDHYNFVLQQLLFTAVALFCLPVIMGLWPLRMANRQKKEATLQIQHVVFAFSKHLPYNFV